MAEYIDRQLCEIVAEYDKDYRLVVPLSKIRRFPTSDVAPVVHGMKWINVKDRLPDKDGWYLVFAPGYLGNSRIYGLDGMAYSNFKHNYKEHWGIERGVSRGWSGIVTHWMPLPEPPKD